MSEAKFCRDCAHMRHYDDYPSCARLPTKLNLVNGKQEQPLLSPHQERSDEPDEFGIRCGPEGKFWLRK